MAGDYTQVPLRRDERWTAARMQQGRVLLDHDWNLNVDASARAVRDAARAAIGWAGVNGTAAFEVGVTAHGPLDLTFDPGVMWVDGLAARTPNGFNYLSQEGIAPLPAGGNVLVYLDVWDEHVQAAEAPSELIDPALSPIDTTTRGRVGYRARVAATAAQTCNDAWDGLVTTGQSTGTLSITRVSAAPPPDPCSPPGDPLAQVPDGLLLVEVLDHGTEATARFAWSFEDGATAVPIVSAAGNSVGLAPSNLHPGVGDLVEVSWLMRRADRLDHGPLYTVQDVTPGAGGDTLQLDRPVTAPANAAGLCVRRWDGEAVGAAAAATARWHGLDLGIRFSAGAGEFLAGDWWGARLRAEEGDGIEHRTAAEPDGTGHAFAPLALVDLTARTVLHDCRPTFLSLVDLDFGGACTISVKPGDDLQAAVDRLPRDGGELCLAAGLYELSTPLVVSTRRRIVINGAGPATVIRALGHEAAIVFSACSEIDVRDVRVEGGTPGDGGDPDLEGALTFLTCGDISVHDCSLFCPDQQVRTQTCITVRSARGDPASDGVRIERNRLEVGGWQTGILVVDAGACVVADNRIGLTPAPGVGFHRFADHPTLGQNLIAILRQGIRPKSGPGVSRITVPGADRPLLVQKGSQAELIARDFAELTTAAKVKRAGGAEKALLAFAKQVGQGSHVGDVSPGHQALIAALLAGNRAAGQGIVVAGGRLASARIDRNLVEDVVQGIHVGVSDARFPGREGADTVIVSGNIVHNLVPVLFNRDRHAVFVGNARTTHITDTVATLRRLVPPILIGAVLQATPVEGIRVHGTLGPFLTVRQSSLSGFDVGVTVIPLPPLPRSRLWLVAETFAFGSATVVNASAAVLQERNFQ
jgi:hypothetical protein